MYQDFNPFPPDKDHDPWPWRAGLAAALVLFALDELTSFDLGLVTIAVTSVVIGVVVLAIRLNRKGNRK